MSPDVDGPWPTIPLTYADANSNNGSLNVYVTFSNTSLLVSPQTCTDDVTNGTFRCGDFVYPDFYLGNNTSNLTMIDFFEHWDTIVSSNHTGLDYADFMALSGNATENSLQADIGNTTVEMPAIVADNLTTVLSNSSQPIPLLNSMLSLPNYAAKVSESGAAVSRFFSLYTGSMEPFVNGALMVGAYDNNRILGNLMNWSTTYMSGYGPASFISIMNINIGVESGFLPLEKFKLLNDSFLQGPQSINVEDPTAIIANEAIINDVLVEPGSPYLHLDTRVCDWIADQLDLTYDITRNLYLWSYPPDPPIFQSPVYLEIITSNVQYPDNSSQRLSVKIPMALLQHTFHATTRATNGTLLPLARYFPCSRWEYNIGFENGHYLPMRLGRAFLQAAFIASYFEYPDDDVTTAKYWLAQAPGPATNEENGEDIVEVKSGCISNRTNVTVDVNAWTKSWSGVLPIWTLDSDGKTTLDQLNAGQGAESKAKELAIKVGIPVAGTVLAGVLLFFSIRGVKNSRATRRRIKREIAEEDATAREIERLLVSEKELLPISRRSSGERLSVKRGSTASSLSKERMRRVLVPDEVSLLEGQDYNGT